MKTLDELLAGVRDCEKRAEGFAVLRGMVRMGDRTNCANDGYLEGHAAACDVLIPVLRLLMAEIEDQYASYDDGHSPAILKKVRALLESKEV
jgi:hypothetical protein